MEKNKMSKLNFKMKNYSTQILSPILLEDVKEAIKSITDYGSVEIYIQGGVVSQISTRKIKKTDQKLKMV